MHEVPRPKPYRPPVRFYEPEEVKKIIEAAPSAAMRALWSLMYGSGAEITPSLKLRRRDFIEAKKEVRIRATKERSRDRVVRVGDAHWPHVKAHLATLKPADMVWPGWRRWWPPEAHRTAVTDLGLDPLPLYCSRHHWAACRVRIGTPIPVIQHQLGHSSPRQTLEVYSRFVPASDDRERWEKLLTRTTRHTTVTKSGGRNGKSKKPVTHKGHGLLTERETGLEPATPTLARLCSTN
jgi:integrase